MGDTVELLGDETRELYARQKISLIAGYPRRTYRHVGTGGKQHVAGVPVFYR